jgi:SAM-dependent methyltransferase
VFQRHPVVFSVGLEGVALLRAHAGDIDDVAFVRGRLDEIRRLLSTFDSDTEPWSGVDTIGTVAGYAIWSQTYDSEDNPLIDVEQPVVREILGRLPVGRALDVACGSGRHATWLAERGHTVLGVDSSPAMLALARAKGLRAVRGDLGRLPVASDAVDLVVCTLALTHNRDLPGALAELARVVRPGGHIVLADIHVVSLYLGGVAGVATADGYAVMPAGRYWPSDYLNAVLAAGLEVVSCHEPRWSAAAAQHCEYPDGPAAAYWDTPALIVWHLRKPEADRLGVPKLIRPRKDWAAPRHKQAEGST